MMRSRHLAGFAILVALGTAPICGAATSSVSGVVRDSSGEPQIGAEVQLLRPDLTVITSVYTNSQGRFLISSLMPGRYAVKAMGLSFLPSLRENVRVHGGTVVNLTLNTLYEVVQWLPADPRASNAQSDDWAWTLRSAANRPLLRWLEDGPLVVVSDGSGSKPKLMARLMATGQAGTFGESGERFSTSVEDTPTDSRELLARVDFSPDSNAGMESMLGFRQDLGFAGSVESVAAVTVEPDVMSAGGEGLEEASVRNSETMHFGDMMDAEAGANLVMARLDGVSTTTAMLPFASVAWHEGNATLHYRLATMIQDRATDESEPGAYLPAMVERNGAVAIERGKHQEIGWERRTDAAGMSVLVYSDNIENPVLQAMSRMAAGESQVIANSALLFDPASGLIRAAGPSYGSAGVQANIEHRLPGGNFVQVSYTTGSALVIPAMAQPVAISQVISSAHTRRAQMCSISLSGTLDGTGTHWRASYSWQPEETVTELAPFAVNGPLPFLNVQLRQPIHLTRDGSGGFEALLDVRNLLAEGYSPYILSDGSLLIFAQDQRSLRAGLAFTF
jgi:Carboxypeptidase regulatory-like domain